MNKIIWACWWGGNALILLALLRVVPVAVGWAGFVAAFFAFLAPGLIRRRRRAAESTPRNQATDSTVKRNEGEESR